LCHGKKIILPPKLASLSFIFKGKFVITLLIIINSNIYLNAHNTTRSFSVFINGQNSNGERESTYERVNI
jgi:hypothetical protein